MTNKKTTLAFLILAVLPSLLALVACNPLENDSKSSTFILVESMTGKDLTGGTASFLQSDVVSSAGAVFADIAAATVRASMLDPAPILNPSGYSDIILDRYVVAYSRSDGRSRQGIDVPYSFEGSLTQLVKVGATATFSFVIVREVAKMEPPLIGLAQGIKEGVIEMTAKVDFYGHDLTNNKVTATGYLTIFFTNYAD
ncbi:MAG TPA: hypothetical protein VHP61_01690 [Acidobacteriota bacterium]|nr:hypothetical protein [Acidobacteriota bacterium]